MGLSLYNADQDIFTAADIIKTTYNGRVGTLTNTKLHIRNNNPNFYYQNIEVTPQQLISGSWVTPDLPGWSIKLKAGENQPTESEWDLVTSNDPASIADIGEVGDPDTTTYRPFWIRVYCPPGTPAQVLDQFQLSITYVRRVV